MTEYIEIEKQPFTNTINVKEMTGLYSKKKFLIHSKEGNISVFINEISHIVQEKDYTTIYTMSNGVFHDNRQMLKIEKELTGCDFLQANFKTLINTGNISCIYFGNNRSIILTNNTQIKISRRRLHLFKALVKN